MKKATGKVVSLVLALALVITSFSATFAFAATETGEAHIADSHAELYLSNTNRDDINGDDSDLKQVNLSALLAEGGDDYYLETYDHQQVEIDEIAQISVSGDNIVKISRDGNSTDGYTYYMTVRDKAGTGTATLNILFKGSIQRDDDEDETTVRGSAQIKVTLLDANTPILAPAGENPEDGDSLDSIGGLQKNANGTLPDGKDSVSASTGTVAVYLPQPSEDALATYVPATNVSLDEDALTTADYYLQISGNKTGYDTTGGTITFGVKDPAVGNSVRLNLYAVEDGKKGNKVLAKETVKVENKLVVDQATLDIQKGDGDKHFVNDGTKADTTASKSKTYALVDSGANKVWWDVTGANVVNNGGTIDMTDGKTGDLKADAVVVNDGTAANVEATDGNVTLDGGSITSAKASADVNVNGATVGEVKDADTLTVTSGKVTGAVSATNVELRPLNDEESISVGNVTAKTLTVDGTEGTAAAGNFTASASFDERTSTVTLMGNKASVGSIDFDYWVGTLDLNGFVGTVSAPTKATIAETKITSTEGEVATNAVVTGNLAINTIDLSDGTVQFNGNVRANNVYGGEATMVINAGALEVTESVSTSNTLKLADAADVVNGTVVYRASTDVADEDSFIGYGFSVRMVSGSSQDAFVIDDTYFAGLTMNVASADVLLGTSETFTASAYPVNTTLPEGAHIRFFLDGDENYITGVDNGNGTATIQALKYDSTFSSLNEATLTAYVYDEYDIELEEYGSASVNLRVIEKPKTTYVSDTTGNVDVALGNTYQFKITSTDGSVPSFAVAGDGNIFRLVEQSNSGNDYFFKVQAVGTPGQVCGVYINREATPVATLTVGANFTCDTTAVNVAAGASYIAKVTANEQPVVAAGNSSYTVELASQSGNDYFFRITAVSAQAGDQVGFYINSSAAPVFIATTV